MSHTVQLLILSLIPFLTSFHIYFAPLFLSFSLAVMPHSFSLSFYYILQSGDTPSMYNSHTGLGLLNPLNVVPLYSLFKMAGGSDLW